MKMILSDPIQKHFNHPIYCVLGAKQIYTIEQMIFLSDTELKSIRNFGPKALSKVEEFRILALYQYINIIL